MIVDTYTLVYLWCIEMFDSGPVYDAIGLFCHEVSAALYSVTEKRALIYTIQTCRTGSWVLIGHVPLK